MYVNVGRPSLYMVLVAAGIFAVFMAEMNTSLDENWQAGKTVLECNKYMLDNQLYCDVQFKVGETGKLLSAHKYVLASRSSVFAAMFFGGLQETSDVITVPDIEPDVFDILLRFLYYECGSVSCSTVFHTLYAAEKYGVSDLVVICQSYMESIITEETVCDVMDSAFLFNMGDLFSKCLSFITNSQSCAKEVFESSGFLRCNTTCLVSLVKSDELPLSEEIIYKSLIRWAYHRCKFEGRNKYDSKEIRSSLGDLIPHVRFPLMSLDIFRENVVCSKILTLDEKRQNLHLVSSRNIKGATFNHLKRTEKMYISRVLKDNTKCYWTQLGGVDAISLEVNKPILLYGLMLYGSPETPYTYSVEVKILSSPNTIRLHFPPKNISESSKTFQINFEKPCQITSDEEYTLWVKMTGPPSYEGEYSDNVNLKDFVFRFHNSHLSSNATDVGHGQIPGFICCIPK